MSDFPERDKLNAAADKIQAIGDFLEYCSSQNVALCRWQGDDCAPVRPGSVNLLFAGWLGVDLAKLEAEDRALLEQLRQANGTLR
jgi:hypothetical protein